MKQRIPLMVVLFLVGCAKSEKDLVWMPPGAKPHLVYFIEESTCFNCVEQLIPFKDLMSEQEEHLAQKLVIISSSATDRQHFGEMLQLLPQVTQNTNTLQDLQLKTHLPVMMLVHQQKILYIRPISFIGQSPMVIKEEILGLLFEFCPT